MGLGILEDTKMEHVPGTALLADLHSGPQIEGVDAALLKHDPSSDKIILVPQPSDSPNDPYNWPKWKKWGFCLAFTYCSGVVGAIGPILNPALVQAAAQFDVSLTTFNIGVTGALLCLQGFGAIFLNSLAVVIGKRPVYLFSGIMLTATSFWIANVKSLQSLEAARALQGFFMAPYEALIPSSIADAWFVHQRGTITALFNLAVLGGINIAGPISGVIYQDYGFNNLFYGLAGSCILLFILTFFFMPETCYVRPNIFNTDMSTNNEQSEERISNKQTQSVAMLENAGSAPEAKYSYAKTLLPWSGYLSPHNIILEMLRPYKLCASPIVLWTCLMWLITLTWSLVFAITVSQIFSAPPYNFTVTQVGLVNIAGFIGSLIGAYASEWLSDWLVTVLAKRNNGIYEPEFRLVIMLPYLILAVIGLCVFGGTLDQQAAWPIPVVLGFGVFTLGAQLGANGVVTYVTDCYRDNAGEAFAPAVMIRNLFGFGMTFYINNWLAEAKALEVFGSLAVITVGCTVLGTVPMYVYGKRVRSWARRNKV